MSRYISKLPPEIRELAEKRRSEFSTRTNEDHLAYAFNWASTFEKWDFWDEIERGKYSVFYTLYPQSKNCTCNSRTVDETFSNVVHSTDCELYESKHPQKDKLDELIEFIEDELDKSDAGNITFKKLVYVKILNKAKEIKDK